MKCTRKSKDYGKTEIKHKERKKKTLPKNNSQSIMKKAREIFTKQFSDTT